MLLPIRSKNPPEQLPWVSITIIAINVLVFIVVNRGLGIPDSVVENYGLTPSKLSPITFLTSAFLHADIFHLLGNMWFLYLFGFAVEGRMGWWKYLLLYLAAGLAGDLLHVVAVGAAMPDVPSIGASGAVMGLIGAAVYLFPHAKIVFFYWFGLFWIGTFEVAMMWVGMAYLALDILSAALTGGLGGGVANLAHIGGAIGGFLLALALRIHRDTEEVSEAKASLAESKDYSLLNFHELVQLAAIQPENTELTVHWALAAYRTGRVDQALLARLKAHQQRMIATEDEGAVASVFAGAPPEAEIKPVFLLECGRRAEKLGNPNMATQLYNKAFHSPLATEEDQQTAAFRNAMVMEAWHQNYAGAEELYLWILSRWPVTPMEPQIRSRLAVVTPRASDQRSKANPLS